MWGWLAALIEGLGRVLNQFLEQRQGRRDTQDAVLNAKRADDAMATLEDERRMTDALATDRARRKPYSVDELRERIRNAQAPRDDRPAPGGSEQH